MRKHKSVVAILLAVMMIFTFMPTMAFAAIPSDPTDPAITDYKFSDDLSQIVKSDGTTRVVGTVKEWTADGTIVVKADTSEVGDLPTDVKNMYFVYVDLNDSTFLVNNNDIAASYNSALTVAKVDGLKLKKPAYAKAATGVTTDTAKVSLDDLKGYVNYYERHASPKQADSWTCEVKLNGKSDAINPTTEDQPVEVTLEQTWLKSNTHRVVGAPAAANTKVNATGANPKNAEFYIDKVDKDIPAFSDGVVKEIPYDGAEHSVVMAPLKNYTVKYTVFNDKTGNWDKVETVTVKDAGESKVVTADIYDSNDKKVNGATYTFTIKVVATTRAQVVFDKDGDLDDYTYRVDPGTLFDPAAFLTAEAIGYTTPGYWEGMATWVPEKYHPASDADKAAVAANKDEILAWFKDYYEIEQTSTKAHPEVVTLTIKAKKLSSDERKALAEKYKDLLNRFAELKANTAQTGTVVFKSAVVNDKDDDISFEGQTKFVYSGKKTTKKGVLKSKKTITVNATADSGNAITYVATKKADGKIVVSADGKITVKKGLKKGTYTVTVKAKTKAGNGYKAAKEKQTYVIKIAK